MVRSTPKAGTAPRRGRGASAGSGPAPPSAAAAATAATTEHSENGATGLFRAVLSWDFAAVVARLATGKGVIEGDLGHVPKTFTSAEVREEGGECAKKRDRGPAQPPSFIIRSHLLFPPRLSLATALRLHL